jgi:hypothetical protein
MSTKAWWISSNRLRNGDNRIVKPGRTHKVEGKIELCYNGLHGSINPLHALSYSSGQFWRTEHSGTIVYQTDKLASSHRTYLWRVKNTGKILEHFRRLCALDVIHLWDPSDLVVRYLRTGKYEKAAQREISVKLSKLMRHNRPSPELFAVRSAKVWRDNFSDNLLAAFGHNITIERCINAAWAAEDSAHALSVKPKQSIEVNKQTAAFKAAWGRQNNRLHRMLMEAERVTK